METKVEKEAPKMWKLEGDAFLAVQAKRKAAQEHNEFAVGQLKDLAERLEAEHEALHKEMWVEIGKHIPGYVEEDNYEFSASAEPVGIYLVKENTEEHGCYHEFETN